jgi:hypothetical protein
VAVAEKRVVFTLTCIDVPAISVSFEPEGANHVLRAGDWFRVEMVGPEDGEPEISYLPESLIVGAWSGARTRVWDKAGDQLPT